MLETFWGDLRYIGRRMLRAPALTGMIVLILALGVGANAAVFSVLEEAVLAPVPFPDADGLVVARWTASVPGAPDTTYGQWSYPEFVDFREATGEVFQGLALYASRSAAVTEPGQAETMGVELVTPGYFELLGVVPSAGRFFTPEEEGRDAAPGVVVISHAFWVQRFGGNPNAVGRTIVAAGSGLQVVGVAPEGFTGLTGSARMWIPVGQARETFGAWILESRGSHWHHVLGRLRPGLTPSVAEERVAAAARAVDAVDSHLREGQVAGVALPTVGEIWSNPQAQRGIWLAMAAALVVLAITVANLASLLLARGRRELQETAVRLALGAPKRRLIRERLTEGLAVAALGGGVGLAAAAWMLNGLRAAVPSHLFRGSGGDLQLVTSGAFGMDVSVALFGLGMALAAGALFSAAPAALQGTVDLVPALRRGGAGSRNPGRQDGNRVLVGAQVALSVVLLVGAGLLLGSLYRLHAQQEGFDADHLLILRYSLGGVQSTYETPEAAWEFHRTFRDRVRVLPGVRGAALGTTPPLSGSWATTGVTGIVGRQPFAEGERPQIAAHFVGEDYFALLGIPTLEGSTFQGTGGGGSQQDVVISRRTAETLFAGESPVGRELEVGMRFGAGEQRPFRVIGVVDDVLYTSPASGVRAEMFVGMTPWTPLVMSLMVRTEGDPYEVLPEARRVLADLDPVIPFWQVTTGRELRAADVADTRALVLLLGGFAGLALLLSTAGL
jgi:predicted permease